MFSIIFARTAATNTVLFSLLLITSISFVHTTQATLCNGHESLCSRRYNEVTYLVTHDSYAEGNNIAATQSEPIIQQLNKGVRGLKFSPVFPEMIEHATPDKKSDPHNLHLCHTSCTILDAGSAIDTLNQIGAWLKENPGEIVTIFWNNLYDYDIGYLAAAYEASMVVPYIYTYEQDKQESWPTLQEMIDSGKRLVSFVDSAVDTSKTPWLMDEFSLVFETPYDNTNLNEFKCTIDRPLNPPNPENMMYLVNHFLYGVIDIGMKIQVPQREKARETNGKSLQKHVDECTETFQRKPNFIEVDFYERGNVLEYIASLNDVPAPKSLLPPSTNAINENPAIDISKISSNALDEINEKGKSISHVLIDNISSSASSHTIFGIASSSLIFSYPTVITLLLILFVFFTNVLYQ